MSDLTFKLSLVGVNLYTIGAVFTFAKYKLDHEKYVEKERIFKEAVKQSKYNGVVEREVVKQTLLYAYAYRPITAEVLFSICIGWPVVLYSRYKTLNGK